MTTNFETEVQKLATAKRVGLHKLNATRQGGTTYYFTNDVTTSGTIVTLNGIEYTPVACKFEGLEINSTGSLPRPTLIVANTNLFLSAAMDAHSGFVGSIYTYKETFDKYLDGGSSPDVTATSKPVTFEVYKSSQNKYEVRLELKSPFDNEGYKIPARLVLADTCQKRYRTWNGTSFDYSSVDSCPYTGTDYFTVNGVATTAANDKCGKTFFDCGLRLTPAQGSFFPGAGKLSRTLV